MGLIEMFLEISDYNLALLNLAIFLFSVLLDYVLKKIGIRISTRFIVRSFLMCFPIYILISISVLYDISDYISTFGTMLCIFASLSRSTILEFKLSRKYLIYIVIIISFAWIMFGLKYVF